MDCMTAEVNLEQASKSRRSNEDPSRSMSSVIALSVKAEQPASSSTSIFLQWNVSTLQQINNNAINSSISLQGCKDSYCRKSEENIENDIPDGGGSDPNTSSKA